MTKETYDASGQAAMEPERDMPRLDVSSVKLGFLRTMLLLHSMGTENVFWKEKVFVIKR